MRKNFGAKPYTYPQAVFIIATYDENGHADAMNAAWGGLSDDTELTLALSAGHKTVKNLLKTGAFTLGFGTVSTEVACDYVGVVSGNEVSDKLEKAGFHTVKSDFVNAPLIEELPVALECTLKSYDPENGRLVADIVNVSADESVLNADGKVDIQKFQPIVFDPMNARYYALGDAVGQAFSDGFSLK